MKVKTNIKAGRRGRHGNRRNPAEHGPNHT